MTISLKPPKTDFYMIYRHRFRLYFPYINAFSGKLHPSHLHTISPEKVHKFSENTKKWEYLGGKSPNLGKTKVRDSPFSPPLATVSFWIRLAHGNKNILDKTEWTIHQETTQNRFIHMPTDQSVNILIKSALYAPKVERIFYKFRDFP